jgi:hypothetical protein
MSEYSILELSKVAVFALIPVSHGIAGIVCLTAAQSSARAVWLGLEFLLIAIANGMMWLFLMQPNFLPRFGREEYYLMGLLMAVIQLACYLFLIVGLSRLLGDVRRHGQRFRSLDDPHSPEDDDRRWQQSPGDRNIRW